MIIGDRGKSHILIVDDGVANLKIAEGHLLKQGYLVTTAQGGVEALKYAQSIDFDLILLDVVMPEMNGFDVCRKLKESDKTWDIPVVFLTVLSNSDDIVNGFEVGGIDYITKPFNSIELIARVKAHLQFKVSRKQLLRANRKLISTEQDLLNLLEAVHSGILIVDPADNTIVDINSAALSILEQPLDHVVGADYTKLFIVDDDNQNILDKKEGDLFCLEAKLVTFDGRKYDVIQKVTEVETSEQIYYLVNFIDITDRKHIELLREDISRIIQHDLKGPLNAVVALPSIIKGNISDIGKESQLLDLIEEAGYQMLEMINLSLDMYKMECRTYEVDFVPVELVDVLRRVIREQHVFVAQKNLVVDIELEGEMISSEAICYVSAEALLCYSMFSNILKNAFEATPEDQKITIRLSTTDCVQISIHNNGAVHESLIDTFFDKYSTSGKRHGTGLGTYSAKLIATTLGGDISMISSEDDGTTITVDLPS